MPFTKLKPEGVKMAEKLPSLQLLGPREEV